MCYVIGILDLSTPEGVFRVRVSAFGQSEDTRLHAATEWPVDVSARLGALLTVAIHPDSSKLHAITMLWARRATKPELSSVIDQIPEFIEGMADDADWRRNSPLLADVFFATQRILLEGSDGDTDEDEEIPFLKHRQPGSRAWVAQRRPPVLKRLDDEDPLRRLELPSWYRPTRMVDMGNRDMYLGAVYMMGKLKLGPLAHQPIHCEVKPGSRERTAPLMVMAASEECAAKTISRR